MNDRTEPDDDTYSKTNIPWINVSYDGTDNEFTMLFTDHDVEHELTLSRNGVASLFALVCDAGGPIRRQATVRAVLNERYAEQYRVEYAQTLGVYRITDTTGDTPTVVHTWATFLSRAFEWIAHTDFNDEKLNEYCYTNVPATRIRRQQLPYVVDQADTDSKNHISQGGAPICHIPNTHSPPDPDSLIGIKMMSHSQYHNMFCDDGVCQRCRDRAAGNGPYGKDFATPTEVEI